MFERKQINRLNQFYPIALFVKALDKMVIFNLQLYTKKTMNNLTKKIRFAFLLVLLFSVSNILSAQTSGTLTFSCATTAPSGTWGNKHVLAIWIESASTSTFVKTKAKYGNDDDHLTSWTVKSLKNTVDATTGATLASYETRSVIWNGTGTDNVVVADGTYNIFIEMGWGSNKTSQHSVLSFSFTKGAQASYLTPAGNSNYSNVVIDWKPSATLITEVDDSNSINVFPNPTSGNISLEIKKSIHSGRVVVENTVGQEIYQTILIDGFTGVLDIDLNSAASGLYFVKIISPNEKYTYKVVVK